MVRGALDRATRGLWGRPTVLLYVAAYLAGSAILGQVGASVSGAIPSLLINVGSALLHLLAVAPVLVAGERALSEQRVSPKAVADRVKFRLLPLIPAGGMMFVTWLVLVFPAVILFGVGTQLLGTTQFFNEASVTGLPALLFDTLTGRLPVDVALLRVAKTLLVAVFFLAPVIAVVFVPAAVVLREFGGVEAVYESLRVVRANYLGTVGFVVVVALLDSVGRAVVTLGEQGVAMVAPGLPPGGVEILRVLLRTPFYGVVVLFYVAYYVGLSTGSSSGAARTR